MLRQQVSLGRLALPDHKEIQALLALPDHRVFRVSQGQRRCRELLALPDHKEIQAQPVLLGLLVPLVRLQQFLGRLGPLGHKAFRASRGQRRCREPLVPPDPREIQA